MIKSNARTWHKLADISKLNGLAMLSLDSAYAMEQYLNGDIEDNDLDLTNGKLLLKHINENDGTYHEIKLELLKTMKISNNEFLKLIDNPDMPLYLNVYRAIERVRKKIEME